MADIEVRVRAFIVENFLFGDGAGLEEETSFLQSGIIDSTGVLELVGFIEEEFDLVVRDEELIPDNLDSIGRVARYLRVKAGKEMLENAGFGKHVKPGTE